MDEAAKSTSTNSGPANQQMLLSFLAGQDVACPSCAYNLRGLTTPRCPECGRELKLSVGLTEPYLAAWITLAMVVFTNAGAGLLFFIVFAQEPWPRKWVYRGIILYFVANLPIAIVVMICRRRFMRWPVRRQWIVSLLVLGITLVAFTMFALVVPG